MRKKCRTNVGQKNDVLINLHVVCTAINTRFRDHVIYIFGGGSGDFNARCNNKEHI